MTTLRDAAQQALEALEWYAECSMVVEPAAAAMTALRAALAEPVQEPFGYLWPTGRHPEFRFTQQKRDGVDGMPLYAAPLQRLPLSEEDINRIDNSTHFHEASDWSLRFARAIERAHGIGGSDEA